MRTSDMLETLGAGVNGTPKVKRFKTWKDL